MSTVDSINIHETGYVNYTQNTGVDRTDGAADDNPFAGILSDAVKELTSGMGVSTGIGMGTGTDMGMGTMPNPLMAMPAVTNTIEQAILAAADSGNSNDAMIALMMLMMIMESGMSGGGGDMGMVMQMMASMMDGMQNKEQLRDNFMYQSGASPHTLDQIDLNVFRNSIPDTTGTTEAVLPLEWWRPVTPAIVNTPHNRSAANYRATLSQLNVETAERYRPGREGNTYCNIYVWDATRAMGVEIPYYSDPATGAPREFPDTKGANVNLARMMDKWLKTHGGEYGWRQVTAEEAQLHANMGRPAVASGGDTGHISMVAPSRDGQFDPVRGVAIAQAGRIVSDYMYISGVWSRNALANQVTYWVNS